MSILLSIFTPTHKIKYLLEAYNSLKTQKYEDWEWILVPNGEAVGKIPKEIEQDPRVRIIPFKPPKIEDPDPESTKGLMEQGEQIGAQILGLPEEQHEAALLQLKVENEVMHAVTLRCIEQTRAKAQGDKYVPTPSTDIVKKPKIGALKRFACDQCKGEILCELDHDDMLVPGILEKIIETAKAGGEFIYSDSAVFLTDRGDMPMGYGEMHGWETYEFRVYGKDFLATRAFPPTPRSLCEIYYAPDHIRCWTRKAYYGAGGHDPELTVGDDHDLICRTYLAGFEFKHTESCGYLYRNHPGNTVKAYNAAIQVQQGRNRDNYLHKLIDEWCRRHSHGYLDIKARMKTQLKWGDDGKPRIEIGTSKIGCIRCYDFLQLIPQEHQTDIMNELYRILVPGGWLCAAVPSTSGDGAFAPHHKSYWNPFVFVYYCDREYSRHVGSSVKCRFQRVRCFDSFPDKTHEKARFKYTYADLCALKGQRQPGLVEI